MAAQGGSPVRWHLAAWRLAAASGRAYARLSGDWNPIHLWRWSANLMGMKRPIIHGMHTLGRACAELERAGGRPLAALEARFKAPAALGNELALGADLAGTRVKARLHADVEPPAVGETVWLRVLDEHACYYRDEELVA